MGYDFELSLDENDSAGMILKKIKPGSKVLEFGCAHGRMTAYMQKALSCEVCIVEYDEEAFQDAAGYAADGICCDISDFQWADYFKNKLFDYIIFADVLEHLYDPQEVLRRTKELLKDAGSVFLSLPNLGHNDIVANLFCGQFEYTQYGLLDHTHIHFFAGGMLDEFCEEAGYHIAERLYTTMQTGTTEQGRIRRHAPGILMQNLLEARKYGTVYQYILKLQKTVPACGNPALQTFHEGQWQQFKPCVAVYFEKGHAFREDLKKMYQIDHIEGEKYAAVLALTIEEEIHAVRIDPVEGQPCMVENLQADIVGGSLQIAYNGKALGQGRILLDSDDPQIVFRILSRGKGKLRATFDFYLQGQVYLDKLQQACGYLQAENEELKMEKEQADAEMDRICRQLQSEKEALEIEKGQITAEMDRICRQLQSEKETLEMEKGHTISENAEQMYRMEQFEDMIKSSQSRLARYDYSLSSRLGTKIKKSVYMYYHKMLNMKNRYRRK